MDVKIIFLILPALVCAKIKIKIDVPSDQRYAKAESFGAEVDIISDTGRNTFGVTDDIVKDILAKSAGKRPDHVYLHGPMPAGAPYDIILDQVWTTLCPVSAHVLGVNTSYVILDRKHCGEQISYEREMSIATTTSKGGSITVGQEVEYTFNFYANTARKTRFSFTNNWGGSITMIKESKISSIEVDHRKPGQACMVVLSANQRAMEVEVEYEANLIGKVAYYYENPYKGRQLHWEPIENILNKTGYPTIIKSKEVIKIGFYTDAGFKIIDTNNGIRE